MIKPLEYYYANGSRVKFNKYTIDISGVVRNVKTDNIISTYKIGDYTNVKVYDNYGKKRG